MEEKNITTQQVQDVFDSFLLLQDRDIVRLILANVIGNQMTKRFPIWTMIVAPPSGGKTTLLNTLIGLQVFNQQGEMSNLIHSISDLTTNSFASGMSRGDKETSLLHQMNHGSLMVFKDFTSILSKRGEEKEIIMGQLREIYDGAYIKRTGNANNVDWTGKVGALAGVTQAVYQHVQSLAVMGDRFMFYQMQQPDRKEVLRFKLKQERAGSGEHDMMPKAKELVHKYIQQAFNALHDIRIEMDQETEDEIIDVADFCTIVRSGIVVNDYTGQIRFVPEPEMPTRMLDQMLGMASAFALMRQMDNPSTEGLEEGILRKEDFKLMYKVAYDSIPITRRIALKYLTEYKNGVDTNALAMKINYPAEIVKQWLEQLNALGAVRRLKKSSGVNWWALDDKYRDIMAKLQNVRVLDETLIDDDIPEDEIDKAWEMDRRGVLPTAEEITEMEQNESW